MAAELFTNSKPGLLDAELTQTLRFCTCGSVDDGKSTLIGRLLHESKNIFDDQWRALEIDSRRFGTQGDRIDYALLVDGLQAEREQGITIDVAYRFFSTAKRRFIVADTPGHEQYTRNMATGASTADLAIVLVDARKGILTQTRRHSRIVSMMGVRDVVVAVNKMDLIGYSEKVFREIEQDYRHFATSLNLPRITLIPLSALEGDNVVEAGLHMSWYKGKTLLDHLESVDVGDPDAEERPFCMPVQWVNRPNQDFRGVAGGIAGGVARVGDSVRILPSRIQTSVRQIISGLSYTADARTGDSVTLVLGDEVDASRGNVIVDLQHSAQVADQFEAQVLWMSPHPLVPGRSYLIKHHRKETTGTVTSIRWRTDVNDGARLAAKDLKLNEMGVVNIATAEPLVFLPYTEDRTLGGFIFIDRLNCETLGAGMIDFALRRASNLHPQVLDIDKSLRARLLGQRPRCIWLTGLSGSGKSTIANALEKSLHQRGVATYVLDGDNVRGGLNRDLGFTEADRVENIRRVSEVARLMVDAGLVVIVSLISPYTAERRMARDLFVEGEFIEVFVDAPLEVCEQRDLKGLYAKARAGNLVNFTGIDSPYEIPGSPDIHLRTTELDIPGCVNLILLALYR